MKRKVLTSVYNKLIQDNRQVPNFVTIDYALYKILQRNNIGVFLRITVYMPNVNITIVNACLMND